jgi:iron-sulfur cluster assembly accessory protein
MATQSTTLTVTPTARQKIATLMMAEADESIKLRVSVVGGGCSGFEYRFAFEKETRPGDHEHDFDLANMPLASLAELPDWQTAWSDWLHQTTPDGINAKTMFHVFDHYGRNALPQIMAAGNVAVIEGLTETIQTKLYEHSLQFCQDRSKQVPQNIQVVIDPISFIYLNGANLDYVQDGQGQRFLVDNPNAKTTCGCGSSFSMAAQDHEAPNEDATNKE